MQVNKLIIGEFMPKRLGLKKIHVKNPAEKTIETFLSIAQRTQTQEALETQLAEAAKKVAVQPAFDPKTRSVYYIKAKGSENLPESINSLVIPSHFKSGNLELREIEPNAMSSRFKPGSLESLNLNNHDSKVLLQSPIFTQDQLGRAPVQKTFENLNGISSKSSDNVKNTPDVLAEIMDAERQTKSNQRINGINF